MLYRNWRGLFFNVVLPVILYIGISTIAGVVKFNGINVYSAYLLPGMIAMTIMQTGVFNLAYWLVDLKARGVTKRLAATPLNSSELVGSLILSRLALMAIQILILTAVGRVFFHTHVYGNIIAIIILMVLGGGTFLGIGFLISSAAKSYEEASPITTLVNLLFTFLGNIFFPIAVLPATLQSIGEKLPITFLAEGMRNNFIEHWTFVKSLPDILGLAIWFVIILITASYTFRLQQN